MIGRVREHAALIEQLRATGRCDPPVDDPLSGEAIAVAETAGDVRARSAGPDGVTDGDRPDSDDLVTTTPLPIPMRSWPG